MPTKPRSKKSVSIPKRQLRPEPTPPALQKILPRDVLIPANVPSQARETYINNFLTVTKSTGRLMLMAGDQKIEHLNADFYGPGQSTDDNHPEHFFRIASGGTIGCFATQHGMIARFGPDYPDVPYLVKMNSRTNLVKPALRDPTSLAHVTIGDVLDLKRNGHLNVVGIGYTLYVGSAYEHVMMAEVGKLIADAHRHGLLTVIWAYPRGQAVKAEKDAHLIAGCAGIACALGSDFVKVNDPKGPDSVLREAVLAAGRTGVLVSGGESLDPLTFLRMTYGTIHLGGARGSATGRNIHQHPLTEAIRLTDAVSAIVYGNKTVAESWRVFQGQDQYKLI